MLNQVEKAKLKAALFKLEPIDIKKLSDTVGVAIPTEARTIDQISDMIVSEIEAGKIEYYSVMNIIDYFRMASKIENKSFGLNKDALAELLGIRNGTLKGTSRDELIRALRRKVLIGEISVAQLQSQTDLFVRRRINRITKSNTRAYIANKLLGTNVDDFSLNDLTELLLSKLRTGEFTDSEIEQLIEEAQKETQLARKRKIEGVSNQQLAHRMDIIGQDVRELKQVLRKIDEQRMSGFFRQYRFASGKNIARMLKDVQLVSRAINAVSEEKFDKLIAELEKKGYSLPQVLEETEIIAALDAIVKVANSLDFLPPLEDFFDVLKDEVKNMALSKTPAIHEIRGAMIAQLSISPKDFTRRLLECRAKGWIRLIEGSPPTESEDNWLDINGRRYFYIELTRGD